MTKAGKPRWVPIGDGLMRLMEQLPSRGRSRYVFPNRKTGKPYVSIFHSWDTARRQAGLAGVRMQDLRHSFASFLINSGRPLYEVQKLLGHHSIQVMERYSHLAHSTLLDAANAADVMPAISGSSSYPIFSARRVTAGRPPVGARSGPPLL